MKRGENHEKIKNNKLKIEMTKRNNTLVNEKNKFETKHNTLVDESNKLKTEKTEINQIKIDSGCSCTIL